VFRARFNDSIHLAQHSLPIPDMSINRLRKKSNQIIFYQIWSSSNIPTENWSLAGPIGCIPLRLENECTIPWNFNSRENDFAIEAGCAPSPQTAVILEAPAIHCFNDAPDPEARPPIKYRRADGCNLSIMGGINSLDRLGMRVTAWRPSILDIHLI
jgi:hypothetical protein